MNLREWANSSPYIPYNRHRIVIPKLIAALREFGFSLRVCADYIILLLLIRMSLASMIVKARKKMNTAFAAPVRPHKEKRKINK